MKNIALLGSTGSIGRQTLDVVRRLPDRLRICALAAGSSAKDLADQAIDFGAGAVALYDETYRPELEEVLPRQIERDFGAESLERLVTRPEIDLVVVAISGAVATRATVAALYAGKDVAIATKEVLVAAGEIVMRAASHGKGRILPIDSEHSGLMQCLQGQRGEEVSRLWLTASGGPFRDWPKEKMASARVEDALKHPTWRMGNKITVDSATLMNKGLEAIEASHLFHMPVEKVWVVIHPESVVHAMVAFSDGSVLAQMALPDMRVPIEYALVYPERVDCGLPALDPLQLGRLTFESPDEERFPALRLAREAAQTGATMPAVLNGANEAAVDLFLKGNISFTAIAETIEKTMRAHKIRSEPSLDQVLAADLWARRQVYEGTMN